MKTYINPPSSEWNSLIERPSFPAENLDEKVRCIIAKVKTEGYTHHASDKEPQYEIKSSKTDHIAAHKESALKKA